MNTLWGNGDRNNRQTDRIFLIHLVFQSTKMLNHFPVKVGISDTISPTTTMIGESLHYKQHLNIQIGQYFQLHVEDTPHNRIQPHTKGAISMGPSGNVQGGFKFMSLRSFKKITSQSLDIIMMPDTVIDQVDLLGKY